MSVRLELRGALNPQQGPAWAEPATGRWPIEVLNGAPSYTNLLDATHAWALVRELDTGTELPAAVSFKHVNPSGAAVAADIGLDETAALQVAGIELSPLASAYARARGANRLASYGDFVATSRTVDVPTARLLRREVSDGIIAPGFEPEALEVLRAKKSGRYLIVEADEAYVLPEVEVRQDGGLILQQRRDMLTARDILAEAAVPETVDAQARVDLVVAVATAKWSLSNAVVLAVGGQVVGVGAGQQSRVEATRLACTKAEGWWLRRHPRAVGLPLRANLSRPERDNAVDGYLRAAQMSPPEREAWQRSFDQPPTWLTAEERSDWLAQLKGVAMASDGLIPFRDNIDRAARVGVRYVIHSGGSLRDDEVAAAAGDYGMILLASGVRQFLH